MFIEQQVTSLEISKCLKELGVEQESLFYWEGKTIVAKTVLGFTTFGCEGTGGEPTWYPRSEVEEEQFSAFTVAELGLLLPWDQISSNGWDGDGEWVIDASGVPIKKVISADTEANARGKMLIYLLENKLIKQ